jgi:hypothetical protein
MGFVSNLRHRLGGPRDFSVQDFLDFRIAGAGSPVKPDFGLAGVKKPSPAIERIWLPKVTELKHRSRANSQWLAARGCEAPV